MAVRRVATAAARTRFLEVGGKALASVAGEEAGEFKTLSNPGADLKRLAAKARALEEALEAPEMPYHDFAPKADRRPLHPGRHR